MPRNYNWQKINQADFLAAVHQRTRIIKLIRRFFDLRGFLEVETPQLVKLPGQEPYLEPFKTEIIRANGKRETAYLITSPEYHMKKLICGGLEKIYQLTSSFRNAEEESELHNQEFKILEWYRVNVNYLSIARDVENLLSFIVCNLTGKTTFEFAGNTIDLNPPFEYLTVKESFKKYLDLDIGLLIENKHKFIREAKDNDLLLNHEDDWQTIFYKLFLSHVEPNLGLSKPTILFEYPAAMAALSRLKESDQRWAERFELYIGGVEIANAFSELTDWSVQLKRLEEEKEIRRELGRQIYEIDYSFIEALKSGMTECAGIALGVDRLIMVILNKQRLEEVILFPGKDVF